jgi:lactate dehydrogenase-like 2-hydroxyacid dehydrogenase
MTANKPTIVQTRALTADVEARLQREFRVLRTGDAGGQNDGVLEALVGLADALCPTVADRISAALLRRAGKQLRIIANFGVGYDNIDLAAARDLGVVVTNTPDVLTEATADLAMTLLLMVARRAGEGERLVRRQQWTGWQPLQLLGREVSGKTLGLVGFGRIAQAVARRAYAGFGMQILVYNRSTVDPPLLQQFAARQCTGLHELLAASDFVSLHCPSTPETRHLINDEALRLLGPQSALINTARGNIVDEAALAAALKSGALGAAGLDVYEREPALEAGLLGLENVVLLPHLGSATQETRSAMGNRMVDNLVEFFAGRPPRDRVV